MQHGHLWTKWQRNRKLLNKFLDQLVPAATAKAKQEAADIQKLIDQQKGGFKLRAMGLELLCRTSS